MNFAETEQCRSGRLCFLCRNDSRFQQVIGIVANCPRRLPLGAAREQMPQEWKDFWLAAPAPAGGHIGAPLPCVYMRDTKAEVPGRPCHKCYIVCNNPKSPIHGQEKVWWRSKCNPQACKFYTGAAHATDPVPNF